MFSRLLGKTIKKRLFSGKAIILTGARQTGKTTLALEILKQFPDVKIFNGDNPTDRDLLNNKDIEFLNKFVGKSSLIFIDEGQKIPSIGQTVKLLVDYWKEKKQLFITGSSSFNLLAETHEPLTGRKWVFTLYPLSLEEIFPTKDLLSIQKELETLLIFGSYPEIVSASSWDEKKIRLKEIAQSYLFKDILDLYSFKGSEYLENLLRALALQVGSTVSSTELASLIGINKNTVDRYLHILEENHIIFKLSAYSKNHRREIAKRKKIYFWDLGIRNSVLEQFGNLKQRNDVGALWENFVIAERQKYLSYHGIVGKNYFWRTYDGTEIDYVEEREGQLSGFEIKWNEKKTRGAPKLWREYEKTTFQMINRNNIDRFLYANTSGS